jgi:mycofactocin glycosyltransferase
MRGFVFSLTKNTSLEISSQGYFVTSKSPIRSLRINRTLFSILQKIQEGQEISVILLQFPEIKEGQLLSVLLSLTCKGYYLLERTSEVIEYPPVSIIIPTRNVSRDLFECLDSITKLDYPREKLEVLIVQDGMTPGTALNFDRLNLNHIILEKSQGPATARNAGAAKASGEIFAFIDADCIADINWLKEILPFFQTDGVGAIGGFVEGFYKKSWLDRYEEVSSSLNLGSRLLYERNTESTLYVPTCNTLVSRKAFIAAGGFKDGLRVGEDVDFCWRMRELGFALLYVPFGKVSHKHRNRLFSMLRRRGDYGTSEAPLYRSHKEKRKRFLIPLWASLSFLALIAAILLENPFPLGLVLLFLAADISQKSVSLKRRNFQFPLRSILFSSLRTHFSFYYYTSFHLIRYYLVLLLGLGFLFHPLFFFCIFALLLASTVDYATKKPRLVYPVYLFFYLMEHIAYQLGVFWGCLKHKFFGSYLPVFSRSYSPKESDG